jgi:beta-N-acetylhexosaminidase
LLDLSGPAITDDEVRRLRHPSAGGVILFSRNYSDPDQLTDLIRTIRSIRPELLIAVDHEGGRVQRFRNGFSRLPPAAAYGLRGARAGLTPEAAAELAGWLMAIELRTFDIDFSFAPVLDVDCCTSHVIGDRSFSDEAASVACWAKAFWQGMQRAGMAGVGKHFPGHGSVAADSHVALPVDERDFALIDAWDLVPFRELIAEGLEGIMPAHVLYPNCDTSPAGFSTFWIDEVLRRRFRFEGAVFSDDLSMVGAGFAGDVTARAVAALAAGCDMILVCNAPGHLDAVLDAVAGWNAPDSLNRLSAMRGRFRVDRDELLSSGTWQQARAAIELLNDSPSP